MLAHHLFAGGEIYLQENGPRQLDAEQDLADDQSPERIGDEQYRHEGAAEGERHPEPRMEILQVKDIYKDFSGLEVLTGVTFTVKTNEKHAIIGPNGAGKTTLFNIISGKYRPSSGSILFKENLMLKASVKSKKSFKTIPFNINIKLEKVVALS